VIEPCPDNELQDWDCRGCGEVNLPHDRACRFCSTPRRGAAPEEPDPDEGLELRPEIEERLRQSALAVKEPMPQQATDDVVWGTTSLELKPSVTYERWVEIRDVLKRMTGALQWWWGGWYIFGPHIGEEYSQALDDTGFEDPEKTLSTYGGVCKRFNVSRRRETLTFDHHRTAAFLEDDDEQDHWLDIAEKEHDSVAQFRQRLRLARAEKRIRELAPVAGTFRTIVADPPWPYEDTASRGAAEDHYETLGLDDISYFKINGRSISELAPADGAHLYLWTPSIHLAEGWAAKVARAWDFEPKVVITWVKPQVGVGNWFRSATEHILFCTRENLPLTVQDEAIANWFEASRRKHSEKPSKFYELVQRVSPGPWLDVFAREQREGWTCWGDEVEGAA